MVALKYTRYVWIGLLALAAAITGCDNSSTSTGPGPGSGMYDLTGYSWNAGGPLRYITTYEGSEQRFIHELGLQNNGDSILVTDMFGPEGETALMGWFSYSNDSTALTLRGYTAQALFHLPPDMSMEGSIAGDSAVLTCLVTLNSETVLAGTDDGGVMKYNLNRKSWEHLGDLDAPMPVVHIAAGLNDTNYIFAATEFGIWYTTNQGAQWIKTQPTTTGNIVGLALHDRQTLVVAYENWLDIGTFPFDRNRWTTFDLKTNGFPDRITAFAAHNLPNYSLLYLGTQAGTILNISMSLNLLEGYGPLTGSQYTSQIDKIIPLNDPLFRTFLITDNGQLGIEVYNTWINTRLLSGCTSASLTSKQGVILVGSTSGCFISDGYDPGTLIQTSFGSMHEIVYTGRYHLALTDTGPALSVDDGLTWSNAGQGLRTPVTFTGLDLLTSGEFQIGHTWNAGPVEVAPGGPLYSYSMMGAIAMHVDELWTPDMAHMYTDVLLVEYTLEGDPGSNVVSDARNWKIYFAKGLGPVMIQEYDGMQLLSTSYLDTGYSPT